MRFIFLFAAILSLSACGGGGYHQAKRVVYSSPTSGAAKPMPFASGPISKARMASDRKARSREICGCIQAVANTTLSGSDQNLAAGFYGDPHRAQVIRQSDRAAHERFWQSYKAYASAAESTCS